VSGFTHSISPRAEKLIGPEAFGNLYAAYGGTEINIPNSVKGEQYRALEVTLGESAARKLIQAYGGDRLYVANCTKKRIGIRNDAIRADFDSLSLAQSVHESMRLLSRKYHLSNRQLTTILKRVEG
jgi:Mor family transcriptional regulator